jgi:hypothetical protein
MCKRESLRERKWREKSQFLVSWSVGGAMLLPLGFFFGSFCPKSFFLLISCFFARRLCLFRKFDVFVLVVARRVEKKPWVTNSFYG